MGEQTLIESAGLIALVIILILQTFQLYLLRRKVIVNAQKHLGQHVESLEQLLRVIGADSVTIVPGVAQDKDIWEYPMSIEEWTTTSGKNHHTTYVSKVVVELGFGLTVEGSHSITVSKESWEQHQHLHQGTTRSIAMKLANDRLKMVKTIASDMENPTARRTFSRVWDEDDGD